MVSAQDHHRLTPQEYFEWEAQQELPYEYFDSEVFAMPGGAAPCRYCPECSQSVEGTVAGVLQGEKF